MCDWLIDWLICIYRRNFSPFLRYGILHLYFIFSFFFSLYYVYDSIIIIIIIIIGLVEISRISGGACIQRIVIWVISAVPTAQSVTWSDRPCLSAGNWWCGLAQTRVAIDDDRCDYRSSECLAVTTQHNSTTTLLNPSHTALRFTHTHTTLFTK